MVVDALHDLIRQAFYLPRAVLLAIPLMLAWMFLRDNQGHIREKLFAIKGKLWTVAFFIYAAYILVSTVMGRKMDYPLGYVTSHLFPGNDARVWKMNIENMLMFVPYIFLYLQAFKPEKPWKSSLLLCIATTLLIEGCQLIFWLGVFQVSDMVYNIIGGILSTGIWFILKKLGIIDC